MHSFVLDALDTTGADTFSHFEMLIDEHRTMTNRLIEEIVGNGPNSTANGPTNGGGATIAPLRCIPSGVIVPSRLKRLVPGIGTFYTRLPLRKAFEAYNAKYGITKRQYPCVAPVFHPLARHESSTSSILSFIAFFYSISQVDSYAYPSTRYDTY